MAEILVCTGDRDVPEGKCGWKGGEVVSVCPDGFHWGRAERNPQRFRIILTLGTPPESLQFLTRPGTATKRQWRFDPPTETFTNVETGAAIALTEIAEWR